MVPKLPLMSITIIFWSPLQLFSYRFAVKLSPRHSQSNLSRTKSILATLVYGCASPSFNPELLVFTYLLDYCAVPGSTRFRMTRARNAVYRVSPRHEHV